MAKSDLIGGSLWEMYSNEVSRRMNEPSYMGEITEEQAKKLGAKLIIADWGAEACGDAVRLYWAVDEKTDIIKDARFKSFGCGTAIASCDVMCEMCIGMKIDDALKITNLDVENALRDNKETPAIPPQKMHCSVMAYDVIKKAASIYKGVDIQALEEEDIVCECARVSLGTIKEVIRVNDLKTVEDITHYTKAGAFCKSCIRPGGYEKRRYYLEDILKEVRQEIENEKVKKAIEKTGCLYFPLVPQRFVEIAYLSTQPIYTLPIVQNNGEKLTYKLAMCDTYKSVKEKCGEEAAGLLPCRNACLAALETVFKDLNIDVTIGMDATMPVDDFCQFSATKV